MKKISTIVLSFVSILVLSQSKIIVSAEEAGIVRLSGDTRFGTATAISESGFEEAETVFLANSHNFADALAGVPLAHQYNAPILLVRGKSIDKSTLNEIERLKAKKIIILGGEAAVSSDIANEVISRGLKLERLSGKNRFETSKIIAENVESQYSVQTAIVVDGMNFADAMSIAPFAAKYGMPIYLSRKDKLENYNELQSYHSYYIIGGENALNRETESKLRGRQKNVIRLAGSTRYDTNIEVLRHFNIEANNLYIATGAQFSDALTGSVLAAKNNSGVALVDRQMRPSLSKYLEQYSYSNFTIFGGETAINSDMVSQIENFRTTPEISKIQVDDSKIEVIENMISDLIENSSLEYEISDNRDYTGSLNIKFDTPYRFKDNKEHNNIIDSFKMSLEENDISWNEPYDITKGDQFQYSIEVELEEYTAEIDYSSLKKTLNYVKNNKEISANYRRKYLNGYLDLNVSRPFNNFTEFTLSGFTYIENNRISNELTEVLEELGIYDYMIDISSESFTNNEYPIIKGYIYNDQRWKPSNEHMSNLQRIVNDFKAEIGSDISFSIQDNGDFISMKYTNQYSYERKSHLSNEIVKYLNNNNLSLVERYYKDGSLMITNIWSNQEN